MEEQYALSDGTYVLTAARVAADGSVAYSSADVTGMSSWDEAASALKIGFQKYRGEDFWRDFEKGAKYVEYDFDAEFGLMKTRINLKKKIGRGEAEAYLRYLSKTMKDSSAPVVYKKPA